MSALQKIGTAELLFTTAGQMGLQPSWIVPDGLFAIAVDGKEEYVNFARSPLNSAVAVSLAGNKYLTRMVLERHGVCNIPFVHPLSLTDAYNFLATHTTVVAKPLNGGGSKDIHIITRLDQFEGLEITNYILEKYVVGKEVRYLVLDGAVLAVHESEYGNSVAADRPLQRISYPQAIWDEQLMDESLRIADALDLRFAAVDYLIDSSGQHHLLEVNTTPGLKWFHAPTSGPVVDVARHLLESLYVSNVKNAPAVCG